MKKVLLIGEPMARFAADENIHLEDAQKFTKKMAGPEVNVAIGLRRLEISPTYVTRLGKDVLGKGIYHCLREEQIDTSFISFDPNYTTGIQLQGKAEIGDTDIQYYHKNSAASRISPREIEAINFSKISHIYITGRPLTLSKSSREGIFCLLEKAEEYDIPVFFDARIRPNLWGNDETMRSVIGQVACKSQVILLEMGEGKLLTGKESPEDIGRAYLEKGPEAVFLKDGANGAYVVTAEETTHVPAFTVPEITDGAGAGDGFAVGVVSAYIEKRSPVEAALRGNAIGALQVMEKGDTHGLPTLTQLEEFLEENTCSV